MNTNWIKDLARLNLPVYLYESGTVKLAYAGYSDIKRNYYVRFILNRNSHNRFLGRRWFWQVTDLLESGKIDLVISEISPMVLNHFRKHNGYIVPVRVMMRINIDRPESEICNRHVSDFPDIQRKVRKYNLTYEIINDKGSIRHFYDKFYLPYTTKRHGEEAFIEDISAIGELSASSFIMAVKEDGVIAGEAQFIKSGDILSLMRLGLLEGNMDLRTHGVIGAIYYFAVLEGQKMKCRYLDLGGTRPFLTDGLTQFKMGLGAEFTPDYSQFNEYLWLGVNSSSFAAKEFIKSNPVMHLNKDLRIVKSGI
jgi:hypothetical protein